MHRDLKLDNCLLNNKTEQGEIKLIDFGLCEIISKGEDPVEHLAGSLIYFAPELFEGKFDNIKSDMWSSGVIMYYLLIGSYPFHDTV